MLYHIPKSLQALASFMQAVFVFYIIYIFLYYFHQKTRLGQLDNIKGIEMNMY